MVEFEDRYYLSKDGIQLHYRSYEGPEDKPIILCIPGLLRNARDFEPVIEHLAGAWRVWSLDLRGRGGSDHAPDSNTYTPPTYVKDILTLAEESKAGPFVFFGTSLGGILTMLVASEKREHIAGALLNDIGPEVATKGLERIRGYVGKVGGWADWQEATHAVRDLNKDIFPHYNDENWYSMTRRLCTLKQDNIIAMDYDPRIAEPFKKNPGGAAPTLWSSFGDLRSVPLLSIRGEYSDILTAATQTSMQQVKPLMIAVTVPGVGHAPTLDEPQSLAGIDTLLTQVLIQQRAKAATPNRGR